MTEDTRTEWQKRIGVGERQPRDSIVSDGTRTRVTVVPRDDNGKAAGLQREHRSGRLDAKVKAQRADVHVNPHWQPRRD